jgi:hypothetical protein
VKVNELLQQVHNFDKQVVELEGYLQVLVEGDKYSLYLAPTASNGNGVSKIGIEQPLAELRKIIQPMHTLILHQHSKPGNPTYLYNFPLQLTAHVAVADNVPTLHDIAAVRLTLDYPPTMTQWIEQPCYLYTAAVLYGAAHNPFNQRPAKAKISIHKTLRFVDNTAPAQVLQPDANAYARWLTQKRVTIPGWLKYLPGNAGGQSQYVLRTFAVRAALVGVGRLRGLTSIWWRPAPQYQIVRAQMPRAANTSDMQYRVEISGQIDYLRDAVVPIGGNALPQLVFTQVDEVLLHQEDYLFA